ncbi:DUF3810 domain-containing protein [Capnocytophaga gingivalis]|uniref:DUF3810 domain-containing protein n=1 Tax=Capnocytophaga gingivalis TaxID=1017 RepID=A0ABU5Y7A0_9FLAO|nr:DUF3810 domain-containing protein [Capnocytophaga gingivalis]MEB3039670.1 DUF3810 domain-containing protein [Capnocytophaga gingivalis]
MLQMKKKTTIYGKLLYITVFVALYGLFRFQAELTEQWYSTGIYPYIGRTVRFLLGWIPFSVGDILYTVLPLGAILYIIKYFGKIRKAPLRFLKKVGESLVLVVSLFYFLWGFNYYRQPLSVQLGWDFSYTESELEAVTKRLIIEANTLHKQLSTADTQAVQMPFTPREVYEKIPQGYSKLSDKFPRFALYTFSIKSSLYSKALTYMGYSGYLNPFTGEAQVNDLATHYSFPVTAAHEVAHQLGYASEKEANFIGFLATYHHGEPYFKYSATLFALRYVLKEVRQLSPERHKEYTQQLRAGVLQNYTEAFEFWSQYENPMEEVFKNSYDTFLKANAQEGGIQNYDYVTGMLIYYLTHIDK